MKLFFSILFNMLFLFLNSQDSNLLSFQEYMTLVKDNHPIMYQVQLRTGMIENTERIAKGGFDPKLVADWNNKSFDDKNYYSLLNSELKIPTWYGIDLKAGYYRNNGVFLNNSDILPDNGTWGAGISVPLGKGLIIDNRRAELKKAEIYQSVTSQEQILMVNDLLYDASKSYLDWQAAKAYFDISLEGIKLASERFAGTRISFINGDKPAIDTLESFISLQSRQLELQIASQQLENAKTSVNNFLWLNGEVPVEIGALTFPDEINVDLLKTVADSLILFQDQWLPSHPELVLYDYKIASINIDQRLAKEELKPNVRINYNPLVGVAEDNLFGQFEPNNYKFAATFSYPILQRKEKGKIQLNKLKIKDTEYVKSIKVQELDNKLNIYNNNMKQIQNQYQLLDETIANYNLMLIGENRKFVSGESSIFLVNNRELQYLESRYKMIELSQKLIMNRLTYLYFSIKMTDVIEKEI